MRKGFTLIELIVVIAIIAILAAIIAPNAFKAIEKGKIAATIADLRAIKTAAMSYYADVGSWPANGTTITTISNGFLNNNSNVSGWDGPYLEKWPAKAAWGGRYIWWSNASFDGDAGIEQYIAVESIGSAQFTKIDAQIDADSAATAATAGSVRLTGTTMRYLVAE